MLELIQFSNDPDLARRCDALGGFRLCVDLERMGKAERQAGRNTFISAHTVADIAKVRASLVSTPLMVRVNPLHAGTREEVATAIGEGADQLMLPMFTSAEALGGFAGIVDGRVPVVALVETASALECVEDCAKLPGVAEIYVGLNDLHLSLGVRFMFEPLALGMVDRVATAARRAGKRFGFGGIARLDEGLLPGRRVLGEHLRLGSGAVILSRTFHREGEGTFEEEVARLRRAEAELAARTPAEVEQDARATASLIRELAQGMGPAR